MNDLRYTENGRARRKLRAEMHDKRSVVQIGKAGVDEALLESAEDAIAARELIKITIGKNCPESPQDAANQLARQLRAELIEQKGRTAVLFRPIKKEGPAQSAISDGAERGEP